MQPPPQSPISSSSFSDQHQQHPQQHSPEDLILIRDYDLFSKTCEQALGNSNNANTTTMSNNLQLLRSICTENHIHHLCRHLREAASSFETTLVITKTLRFIFASKVGLSEESKNRFIDFEQDFFHSNKNRAASSLGNDDRDEYYMNNMNNNNDLLEKVDRETIMKLSSTLFDDFFDGALCGEGSRWLRAQDDFVLSGASYFGGDSSMTSGGAMQQTLKFKRNEHLASVSRFMNLCAFMTFALYKDYTIYQTSRFVLDNNNNNDNESRTEEVDPRHPHLLQRIIMPPQDLAIYNINYRTCGAERSKEMIVVDDMNSSSRQEDYELFDVTTHPCSPYWLSPQSVYYYNYNNNNNNNNNNNSSHHQRLPPFFVRMPAQFSLYFVRELVHEFSNMPKTSPWDTFASRRNFLTPFLHDCRNLLLHRFDVELGEYFPKPENCVDHYYDSDNNNNDDDENQTRRTSAIRISLYNNQRSKFDFVFGLKTLTFLLRNYSEFLNFIIKQTMHLPDQVYSATAGGETGDPSIQFPVEWKCYLVSVQWYLRNLVVGLTSSSDIRGYFTAPSWSSSSSTLQGENNNSNNNNNLRNENDKVDVTELAFECLREIFSLLAMFSTLSKDGFLPPVSSQPLPRKRQDEIAQLQLRRKMISMMPEENDDFISLLNGERGYRVCHDSETSDFVCPNLLWPNEQHHVAIMMQVATLLLKFALQASRESFSRRSNHSLRVGIESFETAGRILANLTKRYPYAVVVVMGSQKLQDIPTPELLDELAQFSAGVGKYSMMFSEQALRYFLVFANGVLHEISCGRNIKNVSLATMTSLQRMLIVTHRQVYDGIVGKLEELLTSSVNTIFEYIFAENCESFFYNSRPQSSSLQQLLDSQSDSLLSLIGGMFIRKSGDTFFLINQLTKLFDVAAHHFLSTNPEEWAPSSSNGNNNNNNNNHLPSPNFYLLPLIIQIVGSALQVCYDNSLRNYSAYTNTQSIQKELDDMYNNNNQNQNQDTKQQHHPFIKLLFQVCRFSEQIAAGSMNSLQRLLESLSLDEDNNSSNKQEQEQEEDSRFSGLIPLQYIPVIRSILFLFHSAAKTSVMQRGPFASSCVEFCAFVLRSSASSALSLRNKVLFEDAISLLQLMWGTGNEALSQTSFLQVSETLFGFHLEDRLYLTSTAALSSPEIVLATLNHPSNRPGSTLYTTSSFFALRQRTLSLFYQRANICILEGNQLDCRRILNQMMFFTNVHCWSRDVFGEIRNVTSSCDNNNGNPTSRGNGDGRRNNNPNDNDQNMQGAFPQVFPSSSTSSILNNWNISKIEECILVLRCWLKDITAAFRMGKEVMHRKCFVTLLVKGVLGLYEEEVPEDIARYEWKHHNNSNDRNNSAFTSNRQRNNNDNDTSSATSSDASSFTFWDDLFETTHSKSNVPSMDVLLKFTELYHIFVSQLISSDSSTSSSPERLLATSFRQYIGLLSDFLELVRQITEIAPVTLGVLLPSAQPPFSFLFISQFLSITNSMIRQIQSMQEVMADFFRATPKFCSSSSSGGAASAGNGTNNNRDDDFSNFSDQLTFESTSHIIINLSHAMWNMLSAKIVNIGVVFHYDGRARSAFYDLIAFVADSVTLEDMKQLTSSRDALAIANVSVLHFCLNFEAVIRVLDTLTNPRAALEDAVLVGEEELYDDSSNSGDKSSSNNNSKPLVSLVQMNNSTSNSSSHHQNQNKNDNPNATLLSKFGTGVSLTSNNERFFSLTQSYASTVSASFHGQLRGVFQDHELLASWCRIAIGCISFQPERFFYLRTLHCLLGTVPNDTLAEILNSCSFSRFSSFGGATSSSAQRHQQTSSSDSHLIEIVRSGLVTRFKNQHQNNHHPVPEFMAPEMTILDDILSIIIPLLLTNQLSEKEDSATSAIAVLVRVFDCGKNQHDENLIDRFHLVCNVIRDHLCLNEQKMRLDRFIDILTRSDSFSQAVKRLSVDVIRLQPALHSIFAVKGNGDGDESVQKRMKKKRVAPLVPF